MTLCNICHAVLYLLLLNFKTRYFFLYFYVSLFYVLICTALEVTEGVLFHLTVGAK